LGLLALYPAIISDLMEQVSGLEFNDAGLDTLRLRIITVAVGSANLDAASLASQLNTMIGDPSNMDAATASQFDAACRAAEAALAGAPAEGYDALEKARRAAEKLIVGLERDTVRRDIANQVENLRTDPDTIERLEASVASERLRPSTDF
jgi:hypothetical protein